ncbi:MAG: TetR family transcriptional regulator, partial [Paucibacter sp.]|nr:TetR family transcriptional regulator [Roseateles sp.]
YTDAFSTIGLAQCIIVNPGRDVTLKMDLKGDGNLVTETIPASYLGLAKYERLYDGLELTLDRPFDGKWGLNASYTLSKSRGSAEGYVQSNLNQEDAGITQDFDYGSFTHGAFGPLPNDRRHVIKVYGNYALSDTLRVGLNTVLASGRPKSCIGFVPDTVADYAESKNYTSASSYYCDGKLSNRGSAGRTPWTSTFDLQLAYTPKLEGKTKLTLQADVFNIFNSQGVTETNEVGDYARNDTRASLNYGNPSAFQSPRSVRLSARIDF